MHLPLDETDEKNLAIVLDWLGSLIMLGSVWGWMYGKLAPPIRRRLAVAERRFLAMERLLFGSFEHNEDIRRYRQQRVAWGIQDDTSSGERRSIMLVNFLSLRLNPKRDKEWQEFRNLQRRVLVAFLRTYRYLLASIYYKTYLTLFTVVNAVTTSLFAGRIGNALFVFGFLIWNISKGISLFAK